MPIYNLKAEKRDINGKKVKKLRAKGKLPLVYYGHKIKPESLQTDRARFMKIYLEAGVNNLVDLEIDGEKKKILIYEVEVDPVSDEIIHADLYAVRMDEKIKTEIPLSFIGKSRAVKEKEGNLIKHKDRLEVEVLPGDLLDEIEVDITPLKTFDDVIKIKDLNIPETIGVMADKEEIVANVTPPRSEEELEALEEEVEEDVENVEVTTEKKEEGEEGEEGEEAEAGAEEKAGPEAPAEEVKEEAVTAPTKKPEGEEK